MKKTQIVEGEVKFNPYGNWDDVDKGLYIGPNKLETPFYDLEGKRVKVTIEVIEESDQDSNLPEINDIIEFDESPNEFAYSGIVSEITDNEVIISVYNYETEQNELITFLDGESWSECGQIRLQSAFNFRNSI